MNLGLSTESILKILNAIMGLVRRLIDNGTFEGLF